MHHQAKKLENYVTQIKSRRQVSNMAFSWGCAKSNSFQTAFRRIFFVSLCIIFTYCTPLSSAEILETGRNQSKFSIQGVVFLPIHQENWQVSTRIQVDGGRYLGFPMKDGSFIIHDLNSGSHIVEVFNEQWDFEKVIVNIAASGKHQVRSINYIQPENVVDLPYPLKFNGSEAPIPVPDNDSSWTMEDLLMHPYFILLLVTIVMLISSIIYEDHLQKEMEEFNVKFPKMSEIMSQLLLASEEEGANGFAWMLPTSKPNI